MNYSNLVRYRDLLMLAVATGCTAIMMGGGVAVFALQGSMA